MATRVTDEFGSRANPPDASYPDGSLKNETTPGVSNDGSPLDERVGNDWEGFKQVALAEGGVTPNGQPDSVTNPQILDAVKNVISSKISSESGLVYKASGGNSAVENMIAGIPVSASVGDICSTDGADWERVSDAGGDISDFKPIGPSIYFDKWGESSVKAPAVWIQAKKVHLFDGISDDSVIQGIIDGTSTVDVSSIFQSGVNYAASIGAKFDFSGARKLNISNILLPSDGIEIEAAGPLLCDIYNSQLNTPVFYHATGRNRWTYLDGFRIISKDGATAEAIKFVDFEHLGWGRIEVSTLPSERSGAPGVTLSRSGPSGFGFYLDSGVLKVDKHQYNVRLTGLSGANLNGNTLRGVIANDATEANIRADFCTGLSIKDGSSELSKNNIELFDCLGVVVSGYYMERPQTHNVQIIRGGACEVIHNKNLSSAGSGVNYDGSVPDPAGRTVYVEDSVGTIINDNLINANWNFTDITIDSDSIATSINDNIKRDRTNQFNQFKLEVEDNGTGTTGSNYEKTAGGDVRKIPTGNGKVIIGRTSAQQGLLSINERPSAFYAGTGSPEGSITATVGSTYQRDDGGTGFTFYVKETGTGNTGWTAK